MTSTNSNVWTYILMTKDELSKKLERSPHTVKAKMSKSPDSLPPMVVVGSKIRLFPRVLYSAWLSEDVITQPVRIDISGLPLQMRANNLASLLKLSESSIPSMLSRHPESLPPGGKYGQWHTETVFGWLVEHLVGIERDKIEIIKAAPRRLSTAELFQTAQFAGRGR